jgi:putative spermidine/putrescine transport system permease protein
VIFLVNLAGVIGSVLADSFATQWFDTWFPAGLTGAWYRSAWTDFDLGDVLVTTLKVALLVVAVCLALGVPAAYALARRDFPGKRAVLLCTLLPLVVPPITYGIPFATVLYTVRLRGTLAGVVLANLVPMLPFVILVMTPFIEQIDVNVERAARMCGAGTWQVFRRILLPLLVPGMLAAGVMVLVRTVATFELTFLTSGPSTQTLVVALYYQVFASGIRAPQAIDAMAVIYALSTLVLIVVALRFVSPAQLVGQNAVRE